MNRAVCPASLALTIACVGDPTTASSDDELDDWVERPLVTLAELDRWVTLEADEDPLADHRPEPIDCPVGAWRAELDQLEVQTGVCNYLALAQPSAVALDVGDRVIVDLWHDSLDAPAPAIGHVAVLLGDTIIGEAEVAIPREAETFRFEWVVEQPVPAGTPVVLHLHNHGFNAWTFVAVEAQTRA